MRIARCAAAVLAMVVLAACGDDGDDTASPTSTVAAPRPSPECRDAFQKGHDDEAAGTETFVAFRPSVQRCRTLAEWTAAAQAHGAGLQGREAVFVDRTCAFSDDAVKALPICREVKGADGKAAGQ